jgi:hypothetical protein
VNDFPPEIRREDTSQATSAGDVLARIETLLEEQWKQVREGNIDVAYDLGQRVDALIPQVGEAKGSAARARIGARLARLCGKIELSLAQQTAEIAERRERLRAGRTLRRTYGRG